MFGRSKNSRPATHQKSNSGSRGSPTWDVPLFFSILFVLSIAELVLTIDAFVRHQKQHNWASKTEKYRLGFLIFSSARTILLAAVYMGFHSAQKYFHSMLHTVFLVVSTIIWIISGVLIHQMWGLILCNQGVGGIKGGLTDCHQFKIIEIIAWILAGVSVLATIPVVMNGMKRRKARSGRRTTSSV